MSTSRLLGIVAISIALAGCGNEYDGKYSAKSGMFTVSVLQVEGDNALVQHIDTLRRAVASTVEFRVEQKSDKVIFISKRDGKTFVYSLAQDDRGLKCVSSSCQGLGSINEWHREID